MASKITLILFFLFASFVQAQIPTITSFTPTSGPIGISVTIVGTNFSSIPTNNTVFFGATKAAVNTATATQLGVTVPIGATYQPISVLVNGLIGYSDKPFVVTFSSDGTGITVESFAPKMDFATGTSPSSVAIGDFDGDGKADMAITNASVASVSLFRNTSSGAGSISYAAKINFTVGTGPKSVAVGDLDGDGKGDLAVANNSSNTISVLRNISTGPGSISFAAKVDFTTFGNTNSVSIADLDTDGKADIAVTNGGYVSVFRNASSGAGSIDFASKIDFSTGVASASVSIGDIDGDDKADLVVGNSIANTVSVFRNTSTGAEQLNFASKVDFTTGSNANSVAIGDIDQDGKADLAVVNYNSNTVSVFLNISPEVGLISYAPKVDFSTGTAPSSVSIGDLDGNGWVDLVVTNANNNSVSVFRNSNTMNGMINYDTRVDFATESTPFSVSVGDMDGDGKLDLAVANQNGSAVSVFRRQIIPAVPTSSSATFIGQTAFTANWATSQGSTTGYYLDVSTDNFVGPTYVPGYNNLFVQGNNATSYLVNTNLAPGTPYYYRVRAADGLVVSSNSATISLTTLMIEPSSAPSNLSFPGFTVNSLNGSFSATTADGYMVLQTLGASPTGTPVDGTTYTVGNTIGDRTVVAVGATTTFSASSLTANTVYHYDVIAFNGSGIITNYNTTSRLEGSRTTLQTEPTLQPTALAFSNVTISSMDLAFTAASGVDGYVVLRRLGAAPTGVPLDGSVYAVNNTIGDGTVVFVGPGTSFSQSGLTANTTYHYAVFTYNGASAATNYLTTSPLTGSRSTLASEPTQQAGAVLSQSATTNSISISGGSITATGYIILMRAGTSPTDVPVDGTGYTVGNMIGSSTVVHASPSGDGRFSFIVSGLTAATAYHFDVFAFNGTTNTYNYFTAFPFEVSQTTLAIEPTAQPTTLVFSNVTISSMDLTFTAASGSPDGYLVLRRSGSSPTGIPIDGSFYAVSNTIGDGTVVFVGAGTSFSQSSLTANTTYHYDVFSYKGAGAATNYLATSPLSGSRTTFMTEPGSAPTNLTFHGFTVTSLSASFNATTADGYIVLQKSGASPTGTPVDGTVYSVGNALGDGTVVSVGASATFTVSGLTANTVYHYDVIAYNGSGNITNYNTTSRLEGSRTTLQTEPIAQASNILFSDITTSSVTVTFTAASGAPSGYLVLKKLDGAPIGVPTDGTTYSLGPPIGDGTVVYVGSATSFSDPINMSAGRTYHYSIFSYNGSGEAINYFTLNPATRSVITITAAPVTSSATNMQQTSFTAHWSEPVGTASFVLDVSDNNFSNLLPGYAAKPVSGTSSSVTGLTPGTTYQYRVRAINASGQSDNSNTTSQITIPQTPTANTASTIRTNDFKAVWTNVLGEAEYRLDVSLSNFSTYLTGYENKFIPADVTEETVTGLSPNTQYQYRVKALNAGGNSDYSNVIIVTTLAGGGNIPLAIGNILFSDESDGLTAINVSVPITGGIGSITAVIHYRGMMKDTFTPLAMTNPSGNTFQGAIPTTALDELGLEFYITATDGAETPESARNYVYRSFAAGQATKIPTINKFGGKLESYQIISIPFQLEDNLIASIFEPPLGAYDKTKWRLVRFQGGKNTDYQAGLTRINQGESYWFNSVKSVEVKPGDGTSPKYNQSKPFVLKLAQGWNQIATPFPFNIDWDDILDVNGNPTGIGNYKVYVQNSVSFAESNSLQPYSGGFVFADAAKDLNLPVTLKNTAGGRKGARQMGSDIGGDEWLLPITLTQGKAINPMGGLGMHPQAKSGKDDFDDITLPRFVKHLEFNSYHNDFIAPRFSRDVVPTANEHEWKISIESNFDDGNIALDWTDADLGSNDAQLILFDPAADVLVDMKQIKSYSLPSSAKQTLQLFYFRERKLDMSGSLQLSRPFPNPSSSEVSFNLFNVSSSRLEIFDLMGRRVHQADYSMDAKSINTIHWLGEDLNGQKAADGLYLYKLITYSDGIAKTSQGRIIIH